MISATAKIPSFNLSQINQQLENAEASSIVEWSAETFGDGLVMSTSFGIQAAVMLHLVTRIVPKIPVIWVDTGYLPSETYKFAENLGIVFLLNDNQNAQLPWAHLLASEQQVRIH